MDGSAVVITLTLIIISKFIGKFQNVYKLFSSERGNKKCSEENTINVDAL